MISVDADSHAVLLENYRSAFFFSADPPHHYTSPLHHRIFLSPSSQSFTMSNNVREVNSKCKLDDINDSDLEHASVPPKHLLIQIPRLTAIVPCHRTI
jgi:hypothetical protein